MQKDSTIDWEYLNSKYASNAKWTFFLRKAARCMFSQLEVGILSNTRAAELPEIEEKRHILEREFIAEKELPFNDGIILLICSELREVCGQRLVEIPSRKG